MVQFMAVEWGLSERSADKYFERARALLRADYDIRREDMAAKLLQGYERVFQKALEQNQLSNTIGALAGIARLTGLDPRQGKGSK